MTNTFGPRHQMKHPRQGVLNWFVRQLIDNKEVSLFGDGTQIRDVNFVDEVVEALLLIARSNKSWGEAYNIGGHPVSLKEFVETGIKALGRGKFSIVKFPKERKSIEIGNYVADIKKIKEHHGFNPFVSLEDGLLKTFDYYKKHKGHYW